MGILDTLRNAFGGGNDDYDDYDDDYDDYDDYDDGPDEAGYAPASARRDTSSSKRILGNTPRPEAESVSVYTRSGRPVQSTQPASQTQQRSYSSPAAVEARAARDQGAYGSGSYGSSAYGSTPGDVGLTPIPRPSSGQLPPYVLKPVSYDDVQTVVRRVRTNQPVVIVFRNTNIETAKRILDFCFGLACGIGGAVEELGDRVFVVLPAGIELSDADIRKLVADGDLER